MKLGLQLKLKQTLAPQLIQSLKMLQMPILKLEQTLRLELATNPLLEEVEELEAERLDSETEFDVAADNQNSDAEVDPDMGKIDWDDYLSADDDFGYKVRESRESREDAFLAVTSIEKSLYDHLHDQLSLLRLSEDEHRIGEYILGNIYNRGYLVVSPEEMVEELKVPAEEIVKILEMIKKFDPIGVGSRDTRESLLIQLKERGLENSLAYRVVDEHLYDLEKKSMLQIAKLMGVPSEKAEAAMDIIKSLAPYPAHGRFQTAAATILPDLIVERLGSEYVVFHNDRSMPKLRINPSYRSLVKRGSGGSTDTKKIGRAHV
jgi:RNA polymerase sigma-54 factor